MKRIVLIALMALLSLPGFCQTSQQDYPLGVAFLSRRKIQEIVPAIGNEVQANIVLTRLLRQGDENEVMEIFYIKNSYKDPNPEHRPPEVLELIYHNLGEEKEFLGIKLKEYLYRSNGDVDIMYREVKLDDKSAQYLLDLTTNDTKWVYKWDLGFQITQSPRVMVPEVLK